MAERLLWDSLRRKGVLGHRFRRQQVIGPYILDFFCPAARLAIEVDGPIHDQQVARDMQRDVNLGSLGIRVLRVQNEQVEHALESVLSIIRAALEERKAP